MKFEIVYLEKIDELVDLRVEFLLEVRKASLSASETAEAKRINREYLVREFESRSYVGWIGRDDEGTATCTAGVLVYSLPPLLDGAERRVGHVLSFYTRPAFRRRGWGRALMESIQTYARENSIARLILEATADGLGLYRSAGFHDPDQPILVRHRPF